jgi:hypothetical protein
MKTAVVTITIGERYERIAQVTHPTLRAYAEKIGANFIVWRRFHPHIHPDFQKLDIKFLFEVDNYERVAFIDTDVIVREDTPNLFEEVPRNSFAAFNEFPFKPRIETMRQYLAGEQLTSWAGREEYFNAGIFVCSAEHKEVFRPPESELTGFYFQSYMNYMLFTLGLKKWHLDRRFNHIEGMNPFLAVSRHDCFILHYAGNGMETSDLIRLIRDDVGVWDRARPKYRFPRPLRLRLVSMARRVKARFRTGLQFVGSILTFDRK